MLIAREDSPITSDHSMNYLLLIGGLLVCYILFYLWGNRKVIPCIGGVVITGASTGIGEYSSFSLTFAMYID